jgi:hypothetical protein
MAEAKVNEGWAADRIDKDVGSLEVFVRDAECMKAMYRHTQSSEEGDQLSVLPWLLDVCGGVGVKSCKHISAI